MAEYLTPLHDLFFYVSELENSIALRESQYVWAWLLVAHIIAMCLFAGTIIMMDLRLMGVGNMSTAFSQVQRRLFPWQIAGMLFAAITGAAIVFADPMKYYANIIFWTKMVTMGLAGLNALAFHFITEYTLVDWDVKVAPPFGAKLAGGLSIVMWANVIVAGRLIPYNWFQ
jgi:hypothetical protein